MLSGFAKASREWVFYTDGDAQYDASEITRCIDAARPGIDIVQGYKLGRGDRLYRKLIGRGYHHVVRLMFGLRVRDTDCDFRLIRRDLLDRVELTSTSGVICVEMMRKFQDSGRALLRGRRQPPRAPVRPITVLPSSGDRPLGPPAARPVVDVGRAQGLSGQPRRVILGTPRWWVASCPVPEQRSRP